MEARADTKISFHEYKEGVRYFREQHPGFYGNFFGDPFYATYDVRYHKLAREQAYVSRDLRIAMSYTCQPLTYDPAFDGRCRGWRFAATDFFFFPMSSGETGFFLEKQDWLQSLAVNRRPSTEGRSEQHWNGANTVHPEMIDQELPDQNVETRSNRSRESTMPAIKAPSTVKRLSLRSQAELTASFRKSLTPEERARLGEDLALGRRSSLFSRPQENDGISRRKRAHQRTRSTSAPDQSWIYIDRSERRTPERSRLRGNNSDRDRPEVDRKAVDRSREARMRRNRTRTNRRAVNRSRRNNEQRDRTVNRRRSDRSDRSRPDREKSEDG